jgi:hypothetical protein
MKINHIIEGVRMGASDLRKAPKKEYTIGFEFEVEVKGRKNNGYFDAPMHIDDFADQWDDFDFVNWFNNEGDESPREMVLSYINIGSLEPKYSKPDDAEIYKFVTRKEARRFAKAKNEYSSEQFAEAKKILSATNGKTVDEIVSNSALRVSLFFFYETVINKKAIEQSNAQRRWGGEYAKGSAVLDSLYMFAKEAFERIHATFMLNDINDFDEDEYIYIDSASTIGYIPDIIQSMDDVLQYFNISKKELMKLTSDEWEDTRYQEMVNAFQDQTSEEGETSLEYVEGVMSEYFDMKGWRVIPDGSVQGGAEIVTPVMDLKTGMATLKKVLAIISNDDLMYTSTSTGLHINVGTWKGDEFLRIDLLKLLTIYNGKYINDLFGRNNNDYTRDKLKTLLNSITIGDVSDYKSSILYLNNFIISVAQKQEAVNVSNLVHLGYLEFRSAGGGDYETNTTEIEHQIGRIIRSIDIASDPTAYRQQYLASLAKLVGKRTAAITDKDNNSDPIEYLRSNGGFGGDFFSRINHIIANGYLEPAVMFNADYTLSVHREVNKLLDTTPNLQAQLKKVVDNLNKLEPEYRDELLKAKIFRTVLRRYKGKL